MGFRYAVGLLLFVPWAGLAQPAAETPPDGEDPGREVFLRKNCQYCHSVASEGIERHSESDKMRGPDLSSVGLEYDREELAEYLETGDPELHSSHWKGFWGSAEELEDVLDWLTARQAPLEERADDDAP